MGPKKNTSCYVYTPCLVLITILIVIQYTNSIMFPRNNAVSSYDDRRYITHHWVDFACAISPQQEYCWRHQGGRWQHLAESFPNTNRSVYIGTLFGCRAIGLGKPLQGVCATHRSSYTVPISSCSQCLTVGSLCPL